MRAVRDASKACARKGCSSFEEHVDWEALFGIPHPALSVRGSDCHFATLNIAQQVPLAIAGLSGGRRACDLGEDFALQGCPLLLPSGRCLFGRVAAAVSDRGLRFQSPRYELLLRTPISPGDQDGPDRPLMGEIRK